MFKEFTFKVCFYFKVILFLFAIAPLRNIIPFLKEYYVENKRQHIKIKTGLFAAINAK